MAYTTPNSARATSYVVTAGNWNELADDIKWVAEDAPACRVFNSANISIATSGVSQALTFNSERYDVGGCHSTVSNSSRLTVPTGGAGKYRIFGNVTFASNATGQRTLFIQVNGTTVIADTATVANTGGSHIVNISTEYALVAGDYVELMVNQTSGGALNATASSNHSPEFGMSWFRL